MLVIALSISGGACEVGGLLLALWDMVQGWRLGHELVHGPANLVSVGKSMAFPYKIEGRPPTLEERMERAEQRLRELEPRLKEELRQDFQLEVRTRTKEIVSTVNEQLTGNRRFRILGIGLFMIGAILSALANIIG